VAPACFAKIVEKQGSLPVLLLLPQLHSGRLADWTLYTATKWLSHAANSVHLGTKLKTLVAAPAGMATHFGEIIQKRCEHHAKSDMGRRKILNSIPKRSNINLRASCADLQELKLSRLANKSGHLSVAFYYYKLP